MNRVIVNADDFGLNRRCTDAICEAFRKGIITDTTMMANGSAFEYAIEQIAAERLEGKVGIHFNITEGTPLTDTIKSCEAFCTDGVFHGKINRIKPLSQTERNAVYQELTAQIVRLKEAGIHLSHADSHHHIHTAVFIAPIVIRVCQEHGVEKIRIHRNIGNISASKRMVKSAYNKWLHKVGFITTRYFGSMKDVETVGVMDDMEIMVHPDYDENRVLIDRTDEISGYAVGKELDLPRSDFSYHFISYEEL